MACWSELKGIGRDRICGDWLPGEPIDSERPGWAEEGEGPRGLLDSEKWGWGWCARPSGLVVRDSGCACSECVAAGAAGEARATEGVAGESSILPWDEAGLSHILSGGMYCVQGFLFREEN